ncbi:GMC family oxidoreductase [Dickeya zeae]|uniref:GMC family oxidoreductase n=1 Tax=Dickeya zeae TaxID=204042 RepID=UPI0014438157|nr:GMC family oxidoreductase [Dickeya zeae]
MADGIISQNDGRLMIYYDLKNSPVYKRIFAKLDYLNDTKKLKIKYNRKEAFTAHAMGGCRISDNENNGVVNGFGEVHGHKGLYIADASVFPEPVGVPPSLSIAAWASYVAENIINSQVLGGK